VGSGGNTSAAAVVRRGRHRWEEGSHGDYDWMVILREPFNAGSMGLRSEARKAGIERHEIGMLNDWARLLR